MQVEGEVEGCGRHGQEDRHQGEVPGGEAALCQQPGVEAGVGDPQLDDDERGDQRETDEGGSPDTRLGEGGVLAGADQTVREDAQAAGRQQQPGRVEAADLRAAGVGHVPGDEAEAEDDDGHVDEEHRPPPERSQQCPGDDRPRSEADAGEGGQSAEGGRALRGLERPADHRHGGRDEQRCAGAHHGAGGDELARRGGVGGEGGGGAEEGHARQQDVAVTEPVTERASGEHQAGEGQCVGAGGPLELAGSGA